MTSQKNGFFISIFICSLFGFFGVASIASAFPSYTVDLPGRTNATFNSPPSGDIIFTIVDGYVRADGGSWFSDSQDVTAYWYNDSQNISGECIWSVQNTQQTLDCIAQYPQFLKGTYTPPPAYPCTVENGNGFCIRDYVSSILPDSLLSFPSTLSSSAVSTVTPFLPLLAVAISIPLAFWFVGKLNEMFILSEKKRSIIKNEIDGAVALGKEKQTLRDINRDGFYKE